MDDDMDSSRFVITGWIGAGEGRRRPCTSHCDRRSTMMATKWGGIADVSFGTMAQISNGRDDAMMSEGSTSSGGGKGGDGERVAGSIGRKSTSVMTFPLGRHVNLDGFKAAKAKAGGGAESAVAPSLFYVALSDLLRGFFAASIPSPPPTRETNANSFRRAAVIASSSSATGETSAPGTTRHRAYPVPRGIPDGADGPAGGDFESDLLPSGLPRPAGVWPPMVPPPLGGGGVRWVPTIPFSIVRSGTTTTKTTTSDLAEGGATGSTFLAWAGWACARGESRDATREFLDTPPFFLSWIRFRLTSTPLFFHTYLIIVGCPPTTNHHRPSPGSIHTVRPAARRSRGAGGVVSQAAAVVGSAAGLDGADAEDSLPAVLVVPIPITCPHPEEITLVEKGGAGRIDRP